MQIVWTLIKNTIIKEYRSKTLLFLFILTILSVFMINKFFNLASALENIESFNYYKSNFFYILISSLNGLMAIILGTSVVKSDIDSKVLPLILALPIHRRTYLISRILGTLVLVLGYYLISLVLAQFVFKSTVYLSFNVILSLLILSLRMLCIITMAIFVSLFFSKTWAFIFTCILLCVISYAYHFHSSDFSFSTVIYYLLPRLENLNKISSLLYYNKSLETKHFIDLLHFVISFSGPFILLNYIFYKKDVI